MNELIGKTICCWCNEIELKPDHEETCAKTFKPRKYNYGWISVKDRMPDKDGRYIIYVPSWNWIGVSSLRNGKWDDETASHWQLLPEPPK